MLCGSSETTTQSFACLRIFFSSSNALTASRGSFVLALSLNASHSLSLAASSSLRTGSIINRLLYDREPGGSLAMPRAMSITLSRNLSFGRIFVIMPAESSSCAVIRSVAKMRDAAFCRPITRANVKLEQASAASPHFTKGVKKKASGTE